MNLHIFACSIRKDAAGCFTGGEEVGDLKFFQLKKKKILVHVGLIYLHKVTG